MMTYKIYKLVAPEHLKSQEPSGYYMRTITRYVMEEPESYELRSEFDSIEEALERLENYGEDYQDYTVQPHISIRL